MMRLFVVRTLRRWAALARGGAVQPAPARPGADSSGVPGPRRGALARLALSPIALLRGAIFPRPGGEGSGDGPGAAGGAWSGARTGRGEHLCPEGRMVCERLRIASELHDLVAHDLSVMTLGVGAGRVIMDKDPERARQTFRDAEESGRRVLSDLRRMMGLLRTDELSRGPQPSLRELPWLLDDFRATGLAVSFAEVGDRGDDPTLGLSAYRIVEEALGNALWYGKARAASVTLRWLPAVLEVVVQDDGLPRDRLVGTWERAALFGGSVAACPLPGGFEVRVRLLLPS